MKFEDMQQGLEPATQLMRSLSNSSRLMLLCCLADGELSVGALAAMLDLRQANVSQHLARLRLDGLVETRRDGQTVYYRIKEPGVGGIIELLQQMYCGEVAAKE